MSAPRDRDRPLRASSRALALESLVPALVHRLNNSLAVVQGVLELAGLAGVRERESARAELETLGHALARLGALARVPALEPRELELGALVSGLGLLLRPLAESRGVELELRPPARPIAVRASGRLEALLLVLICGLLGPARGPAGGVRRLRLSVRAARGRARVDLVADTGANLVPDVDEALGELGLDAGLLVGKRTARRTCALRLSLPATLAGGEVGAPPVRRRARVLLLQPAGEVRQLTAALLREHGHPVQASACLPGAGEFDAILLDEELARADPGLLERLRGDARLSRARILCLGPWPRGFPGLETLEKPVRPLRLLELLAQAPLARGGQGPAQE